MWEPFTEEARAAIVQAQAEARRLGENYIGAEHILLGLTADLNGSAAQAISALGTDVSAIRNEFEPSGSTARQPEMVFTPSGKRCIELAFQEARALEHKEITPLHLLLGITRVTGRCEKALRKHGVTLLALREKHGLGPPLPEPRSWWLEALMAWLPRSKA